MCVQHSGPAALRRAGLLRQRRLVSPWVLLAFSTISRTFIATGVNACCILLLSSLRPVFMRWRCPDTSFASRIETMTHCGDAAECSKRTKDVRKAAEADLFSTASLSQRTWIDHLIECRRLASWTKTNTGDQKTSSASFINEMTFHMILTDWVRLGETNSARGYFKSSKYQICSETATWRQLLRTEWTIFQTDVTVMNWKQVKKSHCSPVVIKIESNNFKELNGRCFNNW